MKFKITFIALLLLCLGSSNVFADRKVSEEAKVFQELKDGVFTVFGDQGHGSGFLIDSRGIILTNQHVIANSQYVRVLINDSTKVAAKVLEADETRDVAALLVNPDAVKGLPVLTIRHNPEDFAMIGERVIAIGSPLNQTQIMTSGIVSKVEEGAIISDVNINHGNSGGPLINMDYEVIAVNTFGDFTRSGGPGVSGCVRIDLAENLIAAARKELESTLVPDGTLLPVMPKEIYPLWALELAAVDNKTYKKKYSVKKGDFEVYLETPPYCYNRDKQYDLKLAEKRKKREDKGNADEAERYDPFEDLKSWYQYVGQYRRVVTLFVMPKMGETGGSIFLNILGATAAGLAGTSYYGHHTYEFKADLKDMCLTVNSTDSIPEIQRGMQYVPLSFFDYSLWGSSSGEDLARCGLFFFPCDVFQPENGRWPTITLSITSIDEPDSPCLVQIPPATVERIWLDFEPCRKQAQYSEMLLEMGI